MRLEEIKIDPEFEALLRKQSDLEAKEMADSIARYGYLNDLICWEGHGTLIDGHHRLRHWQAAQAKWRAEHDAWVKSQPGKIARLTGAKESPEPKEPPRPGFVQRSFADRAAVVKFINELQASRRNMTQNELAEKLGRKFNEVKAELGTVAAAKVVAEQQGVSERTVIRAGQFTDAVDYLGQFVDDLDQRLKSPDAPSQKEIRLLARVAEYAQKRGVTVSTPDNRTLTPQQLVEEATRPKEKGKETVVKQHKRKKPAKAKRIDDGHSVLSGPNWQQHLESAAIAIQALWEDSIDEERLEVKRAVAEFVDKFNALWKSQKEPTKATSA